MRVSLLSKAFLPSTGGVESSSAMLARMWLQAGHEVVIVTAVPGPETYEGARVVRQWSSASIAGAARWADVSVTNGYSRAAVIAAQLMGRPIAILHQGYQLISSDGLGFRGRQFHDFAFRKDLALAWHESPRVALKAFATRTFDEFIRRAGRRVLHVVPSRHVCRRLRLPDAVVMYQPCNPEVIDALDAEPPSLGERDAAYRHGPVRFFGRLVFEKGVDDLINAFADIAPEEEALRPANPLMLEIFGEGPERATLERLARQRGIASRVQFRGFLRGAELVQAARTASVVVIPSRWEEPGATIAVEMFIADAAVIASATGAPGEIFHGHGRLFRNRDVDDLSLALKAHYRDGPVYPSPRRDEPWALQHIRSASAQVLERAVSQ